MRDHAARALASARAVRSTAIRFQNRCWRRSAATGPLAAAGGTAGGTRDHGPAEGSRTRAASLVVANAPSPYRAPPVSVGCGLIATCFKACCALQHALTTARLQPDEGRTPCRRNVGDVTLRDYPRGHQGGAHEPNHCIVGRGRGLDCYFNCRRSCAWLRARHVLQRATLRAAGRRRLSSTPPSLR